MVFLIAQLRQAITAYAAAQARPRQIVWLGTRVFAEAQAPTRLPRLPAEIWTLLWFRLSRLSNRFEALYERWRAGTLPRTRAPRPSRTPASPKRVVPRLPTAHAWVNHRIRESAPPTGRLETLLHDPELKAFVQAAPQAGRLLRPLCRALGLHPPDWLMLPPRPRAPRKQVTTPPATSSPNPGPPPTPDRPLPAYVIAAARAWKKFES